MFPIISPMPRNIYSLTPREIDVANGINAGLSAKQIAKKLKLSVKTVNNHKTNIYSKAKVKTGLQFVANAALQGGNK